MIRLPGPTIALLGLLAQAAPVAAQGFGGLGQDAAGFAMPDPAVPVTLPADHGAHPGFRLEWWYVTANLVDAAGRDYGAQWTLFRTALRPGDGTGGWQSPQIWMGHAAVTTRDAQHFAEKFARGGTGQAGVRAAPFEAWIDDWTAQSDGPALDRMTLRASGSSFAFDLEIENHGPHVLHGQAGHSVKSREGHASNYYSLPFLRASGTLTLPERTVAVTGTAWMDREWSSQPLAAGQSGWDWFSLRFESGARLMAFRLREDGGPPFASATWIEADGTAKPYGGDEIVLTPSKWTTVDGRSHPTSWRVALPAESVDVALAPVNPRAWMATAFPYWEGPMRIDGSHRGRGYLEMTGYD